MRAFTQPNKKANMSNKLSGLQKYRLIIIAIVLFLIIHLSVALPSFIITSEVQHNLHAIDLINQQTLLLQQMEARLLYAAHAENVSFYQAYSRFQANLHYTKRDMPLYVRKRLQSVLQQWLIFQTQLPLGTNISQQTQTAAEAPLHTAFTDAQKADLKSFFQANMPVLLAVTQTLTTELQALVEQRNTWVRNLHWIGLSLIGLNFVLLMVYALERLRAGDVEMQQALNDSEEQLRAILDTAPDAIVTIDERGVIDRMNPAVQRMFGYAMEELIGHNIAQLMPSPHREAHDSYIANYLRTGQKNIIGTIREVQGQRKDGSLFPLGLSVDETLLDGQRIFVGVMRDISEQKKTEAALHQAEQKLINSLETRFHSMAANVPGIIYQAYIRRTGEYGFYYVSPRIEEFYGVPAEALLEDWQQLPLHPEDLPRFLSSLRQIVKTHQDWSFEGRFLLANGDIRWWRGVAKPVPASRRELLLNGIIIDVTNRKQAEAALARREAYLATLVEVQHLLLDDEKREIPYYEILQLMGLAASASRVYIFKNWQSQENQLYADLFAEWTAEGVSTELEATALNNLNYTDFFPNWQKMLSTGDFIIDDTPDISLPERTFLTQRHVRSTLILPLSSEQQWWGFIGFDNCQARHTWEPSEIALLQAAASAISVAQEQRQTKQALQDSQQRFATVLDGIESVIYVADIQTFEILFINKHGRQLYGAIEGKSCWDVLPCGEKRPCPFCNNAQLVTATGEPTGLHTWEYYDEANVRWFYIQDQAITWTDGRLVRMEIATDITERKQIEEQLQSNVQFLETLMNTIPMPLYYKNPQGHYLGCNQAFLDFAGKKSEQIIGKTARECWSARAAVAYEKADNQLIQRGGQEIYEEQVLGVDGRLHEVILNRAVFYQPNGEVGGIVGAYTDVTQLKQIKAQLEQQNNELHSKNAQLDKFARQLEELQQQKLLRLVQAYERFVPNELLQFLGKESIIDVELGDQVEKEMTVLFSDIRGFTSLSEKMTPQENFDFINSYLGLMEPIIDRHCGFIDKYIGDAIMALFPISADDAVAASIEMLKSLTDYNAAPGHHTRPPINIGIGLNSGPLMLGTVGGQNRMDCTVIADAVNLAARVEQLTKTCRTPLLITEETYRGIYDDSLYKIRMIDRVQVKGKSERITVYEVFDADATEMVDLKETTLDIFETGVVHFHKHEFEAAKAAFEQVQTQNPRDETVKMYLNRCRRVLM